MDNHRAAYEVYRRTGNIDVLLTQFSYANQVGNPEDVELRKSAAREKLSRIKIQAEVLKPRYIIPFASFIRFSHVYNSYMNGEINRIEKVNEFIERDTGANSVVLYPGDKWTVGNMHDNSEALRKYEKDFDSSGGIKPECPVVPIDVLINSAGSYIQRIRDRNSWFGIRLLYLIHLLKTAKVALRDLEVTIFFDLTKGIEEGAFDVGEADIITDSDSLAFALRFGWGADTLHVNAKFLTAGGNERNFFKSFFISTCNTAGWSFPFGILRLTLNREIHALTNSTLFFLSRLKQSIKTNDHG